MLRVISEVHPRWIIAENVPGIISIGKGLVLERVFTDLEGQGYQVQPFIIPACAVGAPHRRDRVWIVANLTKPGLQKPGLAGKRKHKKEDGKRLDCGFEQQNSHAAHPHLINGRPGAGGENRPEADHCFGDAADYSSIRCQDSGRMFTGVHQPQAGIRERKGFGNYSGWSRESWIEAATRLCSLDDGLPGRLVRPKGWRVNALKSAGNAIVPQVVCPIMKAIKEIECSAK